MSAQILTNNIKVGFLSFSLGLSLGIGTIWILFINGLPIGALAALAFNSGGNVIFWSLILPHGVIELFSIFICGGAGLIIGYSIINPGEYSRKNSLIIKGKIAIKLVIGTIPLFFIAGIIEGYLTPSRLMPELKLAFAFLTLILIGAYIVIPNIINKKS
jgi:uncharacterized membrane protein SpoIIM required for sporulation